MPGSLHVVSTPIGNLDDITLRAIATLKAVGLIAAEDTRRTAVLLRHFGISTPTTSLHEHNEHQKLPQLLQKLADGIDVALVSDAGTPLVADPGRRLIAAAISAGVRIVPVPGASAVLASLAVSGYAADEFVFGGFAPSKAKDRKKWLSRFSDEQRPVVFFETPHRIASTLSDMARIFGKRPITIARELTKLHEEVIRTTAEAAVYSGVHRKGEFTIVIGPMAESDAMNERPTDQEVARCFERMTKTESLSRRRALAETGRELGLSTNCVYDILERLKATSSP